MSGPTYSWEVFFSLFLLDRDNGRWTTLTGINVDRVFLPSYLNVAKVQGGQIKEKTFLVMHGYVYSSCTDQIIVMD